MKEINFLDAERLYRKISYEPNETESPDLICIKGIEIGYNREAEQESRWIHVQDIMDWQKKTFPKATPFSCIKHLQEEINEVLISIETGDPGLKHEIVDCLLLVIGIANMSGMTNNDLNNAMTEKMAINYSREWDQPDERGYSKHLPSPKE